MTEGRHLPLRRILLVGLSALLAGILLVVAVLWWQWSAGIPAEGGDRGVAVVRIEPGSTLPEVMAVLRREQLLRRPTAFRLGARLFGHDRKLRAGRYHIPTTASPREILDILVTGRTIPVRVTLREGVSAAHLAADVSTALGFPPDVFLAEADSLVRRHLRREKWLGDEAAFQFRDRLTAELAGRQPRRLHWCEGYLAPDTYHFAEGTGAGDAAAVIVSLGLARVDSVWQRLGPRGRAAGLTRHQLVTLASIVEAEARKTTEQTRIAAVYMNRLEKGWRLEADPCVAWLLEKQGQRILYRDLEDPSPWNTYRHRGLPPGPIGNPGLEALRAAAGPEADFPALFFVADGSGGHEFSATAAEHEAAVARYRRLRSRLSDD